MKSIPAPLLNHYGLGTTTLATCFKAVLTDGTVIAATAHDRDLVIDGVIYRAADAYNASAIESSAELNVDNLEIAGVLSSASITEDDIHAGRWDYALVEIFEVNYMDLAAGKNILRAGRIGDVRTSRSQFYAELRGLMQAYSSTLCELRGPSCRATLGDARCKVDLAPLTFAGEAGSASADNRTIAISLAHEAGYFTHGLIRFRSGSNSGLAMEVKTHAPGQLTLQLPMPYPVLAGDAFDLTAGCDKSLATCRDRFSNVVNFRGEPWLPGADRVLQIGGRQSLARAVVVSPTTPPTAGGETPGTSGDASSAIMLGPDATQFGATPTFFDGFDGAALSNRWNRGLWYRPGVPNGTLRVNGGCLEMCTQPDSMFTGSNDTGYCVVDTDPSGAVGAAGFAQKFGVFQAECKLPVGRGYWPAFWLFNHPGTQRPEVDIFEAYPGGAGDWSDGSTAPHPMRADVAIHPLADPGGYQATPVNFSLAKLDLSAAFHTSTLEWDEAYMRFYFDGVLVRTVTDADTMAYFAQFPLYFLLGFGINYDTAGGPSRDPAVSPTGFGADPANVPANVFRIRSVAAWQFNKYGG